jgi:hypothetical protein
MRMNKEQQELLDEAYENYLKGGHIKWLNQMEVNTPAGKMNIPIPYTQEEFINICKTDTEFSQRWGLKIEEQTILEQVDQNNPVLKGSTSLYPRKLITVTYNDKIVESYE